MIRFFQSKLHNPSLSEEHHKVISRLISLKVLCNSYCHIHAIRQQSVGCSISTVEYTSPAGPVLTTTKSKVETALSTALQAQFKCAHGSPFLQAPLALLVGPFRTGPAAAAILEGTFQCPLDVDKYTRQFIKALQFPSLAICASQVSTLLCPEDFIAHWCQAKEHTSSSPLGLHFGHYKGHLLFPHPGTSPQLVPQLVFMTGLSLS